MAETLTEADSYPATIQMPTAGETVSAADLRDKAVQRLADRTNYLENRMVNALAGGTYTPSGAMSITTLMRRLRRLWQIGQPSRVRPSYLALQLLTPEQWILRWTARIRPAEFGQ
jgi:hypothetical protein